MLQWYIVLRVRVLLKQMKSRKIHVLHGNKLHTININLFLIGPFPDLPLVPGIVSVMSSISHSPWHWNGGPLVGGVSVPGWLMAFD